jgi:phage terminase large subunit-like protein
VAKWGQHGCSVCLHPGRQEIEDAMAGGASYRAVARQYGINTRTLGRHLLKHRPRPLEPEPDDPHAIYQRDIVGWIETFIQKSELGKPFQLYDHQRDILSKMFTFDTEGRLPYDTLLYSAPKKSGKTSINAVVTLWFALTQESPNEVYVCANDLEQSSSRGYASVIKLLRHNPDIDPQAIALQKEIRLSNGTVIKPIAADYPGAAGGNFGLTTWDELWGYVSERSRRLWDELTPVPTRDVSIRFITTYAGFEHESLLLWEQYIAAVSTDEHPDGQGIRLHDELPLYANTEARICAYWDHNARMPWQSERYYASQRRTLRANAYIRFHDNSWTVAETTFIDPELWDSCVDPDHRPVLPSRTIDLYVGVDASTKHDSSAVVCVRKEGDTILLAQHRIWLPSPEAPMDLEATIEEYLRTLHASYRVVRIYADPYQMHRSISTLQKAGLPIEEFAQTSANCTRMGQTLFDGLNGKNIILYRARDLRQHALNTVAVDTARGWRIAKERSSKKIDAIVALAMACVAAIDVRRYEVRSQKVSGL